MSNSPLTDKRKSIHANSEMAKELSKVLSTQKQALLVPPPAKATTGQNQVRKAEDERKKMEEKFRLIQQKQMMKFGGEFKKEITSLPLKKPPPSTPPPPPPKRISHIVVPNSSENPTNAENKDSPPNTIRVDMPAPPSPAFKRSSFEKTPSSPSLVKVALKTSVSVQIPKPIDSPSNSPKPKTFELRTSQSENDFDDIEGSIFSRNSFYHEYYKLPQSKQRNSTSSISLELEGKDTNSGVSSENTSRKNSKEDIQAKEDPQQQQQQPEPLSSTPPTLTPISELPSPGTVTVPTLSTPVVTTTTTAPTKENNATSTNTATTTVTTSTNASKPTSEIVVDVSVVGAIFALDVATNTWKKDENAVSNVTIFHQNQPTGVIYQFIGQSKKTNEYLMNAYLEKLTYSKISDTFVHFKMKTSTGYKSYGIQFAEARHTETFLKCFDLCLISQTKTSQNKENQMVKPTSIKRGTVNLSGLAQIREEGTGLSGQSVSSLKMIASSFEDSAFVLVRALNECVFDTQQPVPSQVTQETWDSLSVAFYLARFRETLPPYVSKAVNSASAILSEIPVGVADDIVVAASGQRNQRKLVIATLIKKISRESSGVHGLAAQIASIIKFIAQFDEEVREKDQDLSDYPETIYQFYVATVSYIGAVQRLLNGVETLRRIQIETSTNSQETIKEADSTTAQQNIWEDAASETQVETAGSVNQLVCKATSDGAYDPVFCQTFITTYRSFITPHLLVDKLEQRYHAPSNIDKKRASQIQMRVIVTLKYWVETQFDDFDEDLTPRIQKLIEKIKADHKEAGSSLQKVFEQKMLDKLEAMKLLFNVPNSDVQATCPLDLILTSDPQIIAQQLTLIDFNLYKKIEVTELLNQSWNKQKLKYRSPNVVSLIQRSTKLSMWIASIVLGSNTISQRTKLIEKFVDVAHHLLTINNFNTFFGMVAGFSMSCIHRLKKTFKKVTSDRKKKLENFMNVISPDSSFKNYRTSLKGAIGPTMPYLGVYLTDLTFIEEGNPDLVDGQINFRKREFIYKAIREATQFQQVDYPFQKEQPIYSFLEECAHEPSEQQLYELSIILEPREKNK